MVFPQLALHQLRVFAEGGKRAEGSPAGQGSQIEAASHTPPEDMGYNPLVPGKVVYIHR